MDMLKQLNQAVEYVEDHLCEEVDLKQAARIACISEGNFSRFFSYMTGMTLQAYIRCRRLTLAVEDLRHGEKVIDVAIKYGWESTDSFSKAFSHQHGITPTKARDMTAPLRVYPPASFYIFVKGAKEMNYRLMSLEETKVFGIYKQNNAEIGKSCNALRDSMWSQTDENIPEKLCEGKWNQPGNTAYDGIWYGIWHDGGYMIAREKEKVKTDTLEQFTIPAGLYAAFQTECGGMAWEELPKLFQLIFESWLPSSGYEQNEDITIEVLHLWTDREKRRKKRYYEVLIPVKKK